MMIRYEHDVDVSLEPLDLKPRLQARQADGWELVSATAWGEVYTLFFKRPLTVQLTISERPPVEGLDPDQPADLFYLSVRIKTAIRKTIPEPITPRKIAQVHAQDWLEIRNFGMSSLHNLNAWLKQYGLQVTGADYAHLAGGGG